MGKLRVLSSVSLMRTIIYGLIGVVAFIGLWWLTMLFIDSAKHVALMAKASIFALSLSEDGDVKNTAVKF